LEEALQELDNTAQEIGLIINQEKTLFESKKTNNQCKHIATGTYRFARDSCFPYLGLIITSEEITHRIKERK